MHDRPARSTRSGPGLRLTVVGAVVVAIGSAASSISTAGLSPDLIGVVGLLGFTAVGAVILDRRPGEPVGILRYRLFEMDRIVSRTVAYVLITAVLVAAYALAILVLQEPLGTITGGNTISVALSTLVVAALFQPLRRRIQAAVDRRFDRARFDAERTAAAFSERLRGEVDIATVTADLDDTVRGSLKPTALTLWLRGTGE